MSRTAARTLALLLAASLSACGTAAYLRSHYAGYRVVDKSQRSETQTVPTVLGVCIAPNGMVLWQEQSEGENRAGECRPPARFDFVEGPPKQVTGLALHLVLQAPDGQIVNLYATPEQYQAAAVGEVLKP